MDNAHLDTGANQIKDSSVNGNHGDLVGGVSTGNPSPVGEAFTFDGDDDVLNMPNPEGLGTPRDTDMTIFVQFNPFPNDARKGLMANGPTGGAYGIQLLDGSDSAHVGVRTNDTGRISVDFDVYPNQWNTITAVYDSENLDILAYHNAKFIDSLDYSDAADDLNANDQWEVGSESPLGGAPAFLYGMIARIGLWDRKLSQIEIDYMQRMTARRVAQV